MRAAVEWAADDILTLLIDESRFSWSAQGEGDEHERLRRGIPFL